MVAGAIVWIKRTKLPIHTKIPFSVKVLGVSDPFSKGSDKKNKGENNYDADDGAIF